jgi:hypothetical protein
MQHAISSLILNLTTPPASTTRSDTADTYRHSQNGHVKHCIVLCAALEDDGHLPHSDMHITKPIDSCPHNETALPTTATTRAPCAVASSRASRARHIPLALSEVVNILSHALFQNTLTPVCQERLGKRVPRLQRGCMR